MSSASASAESSPPTPSTAASTNPIRAAAEAIAAQEAQIKLGGGLKAIERQHEKNRLTARERIQRLTDPGSRFLELGLWAGYGLYDEVGGAVSAGVVVGVGTVSARRVVIVANDATVKAGAFFPMTCKKVLRAQRVAYDNRLPMIYLVDSAGVFLPMQDEVFPDEDDFGRIFRNNAVLSAKGIPQFAAILGNCVAGGAYLPVLCDTLVMTDGSGLYLAGPALVKAAIGQEVSSEDLGGAKMHAAVSGTVDYREPDDPAALERLRKLVALLPPDPEPVQRRSAVPPPRRPIEELETIIKTGFAQQYDIRDALECLVDGDGFEEFRPEYGRTLVCGFAYLGGMPLGIVASQRLRIKPEGGGPLQFGGVIYADSAEKAARFVMEANQSRVPLLFLQDVNGFEVGREAERGGIIRSGAKLVNAVSNAQVPKLTVILNASFGAGHYALCGRAFDPRFLFALPQARYAVMGAAQASQTMLDVNVAALKRTGKEVSEADLETMRRDLAAKYDRETDIRYAAARLWIDAILDPRDLRETLILALDVATRHRVPVEPAWGVFQV
jgi:acetyl-CoA carboxylase carboxyltransferase component